MPEAIDRYMSAVAAGEVLPIAAATPAEHADAALIATVDALIAAEEERWQLEKPFADATVIPAATETRMIELTDRYHGLMKKLVARPARTPDGVAAKAAAVTRCAILDRDGEPMDDLADDALPVSLARDVLRLHGGTACVPAAHPDAELIRVCAEHIRNRDAYNNDTEEGDDGGPLWDAYCRTKKAIDAAQPYTLAGLVAKARAAKAEASMPGGVELHDENAAGRWAWDLVADLLRLHAGEAA